MALSPPDKWTGEVISIAQGNWAPVMGYWSGIWQFEDADHYCNATHPYPQEDVHLVALATDYSFWCHSSEKRLYVRRAASHQASIEASISDGNRWTRNPQPGQAVHHWRLVPLLWSYVYSGGQWQYLGPKTMTPITLDPANYTCAGTYTNTDGNSEPCTDSVGAQYGFIAWGEVCWQCGPFGGPPPVLMSEWGKQVERPDLDTCTLYRPAP